MFSVLLQSHPGWPGGGLAGGGGLFGGRLMGRGLLDLAAHFLNHLTTMWNHRYAAEEHSAVLLNVPASVT